MSDKFHEVAVKGRLGLDGLVRAVTPACPCLGQASNYLTLTEAAALRTHDKHIHSRNESVSAFT